MSRNQRLGKTERFVREIRNFAKREKQLERERETKRERKGDEMVESVGLDCGGLNKKRKMRGGNVEDCGPLLGDKCGFGLV